MVQVVGFVEAAKGNDKTSTADAEEKRQEDLAKKILADDPARWLIVDDLTIPLADRATKSKKPGPGLVEIRVDVFVLACMAGDPCDPAFTAVTVITPGTPAVRISDLISFTPTAPTQQMQPNGWMVRGLATN
ncbi:hypothetical protein E3T55_01290, partial [Cryobacterium frigoriphilum]